MLANAPAEVKAIAPKGVGVMTAGAPPAAVTIQRIEDELGWSIIQIYGLTETAPAISICEPRPEHQSLSREERAKIKARQGVELITSGELRVVDDQGREVPADGTSAGEIIARGNVIMQGYYNDPEATEKCMGDGWFHTGDAAVVHPDGYVQITDRLKDVIISGGENISSVEVEAMLLRHDAIQEVAVVGVPHEKWGEAPHAFVVFKAGSRRRRMRCGSSAASTWRTSRCRTTSRRSRSCRRRRPERFRSSCCARAARTSPPQ